MSTRIDHSIEYTVWDDTFSGSVELVRFDRSVTVDISVIMRGPWTRKLDQFSVGNMDGQVSQFTIPDALLNACDGDKNILLRDDVIIDECEKRWTIVWSEQSVVDTHWYVAAVPERVAG